MRYFPKQRFVVVFFHLGVLRDPLACFFYANQSSTYYVQWRNRFVIIVTILWFNVCASQYYSLFHSSHYGLCHVLVPTKMTHLIIFMIWSCFILYFQQITIPCSRTIIYRRQRHSVKLHCDWFHMFFFSHLHKSTSCCHSCFFLLFSRSFKIWN